MSTFSRGEPDWLHGHPHDPNPIAPPGDGALAVSDGTRMILVTVSDLSALPQTLFEDCHILSNGHAPSGPFRFGGVLVNDLLAATFPEIRPAAVDVVSADDFGTRLLATELAPGQSRPPLLAWQLDGLPLTRAQGLVRLIVPSETGDALRQVKWVAQLVLIAPV